MQKDPELIESLIKALEPPIQLSVEKQKRIKEAIRVKNAPPEPVIIVANPDEQLDEKKLENQDFDILTHLDKTKEIAAGLGEKNNCLTKINTICNTLSLNNIEEKVKDLEKLFDHNNTKQVLLLLAYNIVFKRIPLASHNNSGVEIFYRLVDRLPKVETPVRRLTYKIMMAWFGLTQKKIGRAHV